MKYNLCELVCADLFFFFHCIWFGFKHLDGLFTFLGEAVFGGTPFITLLTHLKMA